MSKTKTPPTPEFREAYRRTWQAIAHMARRIESTANTFAKLADCDDIDLIEPLFEFQAYPWLNGLGDMLNASDGVDDEDERCTDMAFALAHREMEKIVAKESEAGE